MPNRITGVSPDGAVYFRTKTPAEAPETAKELIEFDLKDVSITDANGEQHIPADFERLYFDNKNRTDS
jgi:hypothetical protein